MISIYFKLLITLIHLLLFILKYKASNTIYATSKRVRKVKSFEQKVDLFNYIAHGKTAASVGKNFGVTESTL